MNVNQLMKQAQDLQKKMNEAHKKLDTMEVTGSAGGNLVNVTITAGNGIVQNVSIDPSLLSPSEKETLEALVIAAFNTAKHEADALTKKTLDASGVPSNMSQMGF